ncbi:MAG: hypothetical protein ABSF26_12520 [Thermoguttaceae bacterium]|jgi:hypothetical protein
MSVLWIAVVALAGSPTDGASQYATTSPSTARVEPWPAELRSGKELEDAARAALKQWARPTDQQAIPAARQLLRLYWELQQDKVLAPPRRDRLRATVGTRLLQLSQQIAKNCRQDSGQAKHAPQSVDVQPNDKLLRQVGGAGQQGGGGGGGAANGKWGDNIPDSGDDLVELIQTVVVPKSWEANGGYGTIYYWKAQRAIVVRTTQEVHGEISDMLEQLNRASH